VPCGVAIITASIAGSSSTSRGSLTGLYETERMPRMFRRGPSRRDHCPQMHAGRLCAFRSVADRQSIAGVHLRTVVTTRGATAEHARHSFGFVQAGSDPRLVLEDPAIDAVIIATPHGTHANLVVAALAAGKAVFVEKPLAVTRPELTEIAAARNAAKRFFTVASIGVLRLMSKRCARASPAYPVAS